MSNGELLEIYYEIQGALATSMFNYISIITAALVASYLVADKLDRVTLGIVLVVFTLAFVGLTSEAFNIARNMVGASDSIAAAAALPGSGLEWHTAAKGANLSGIPAMTIGFFTILYASVLFFFFRLRWARMKRSGGAKPDLGDL